MGEVNRLEMISNEEEFLGGKVLVNGTFIMGVANQLQKSSNEQEFLATKD